MRRRSTRAGDGLGGRVTPREAVLAELHDRVVVLGDDEVRVLAEIAERLVMGARQYGRLDLKNDGRDWLAEARQEALDLAVYVAMQAVKGRVTP